MRDRSASIGMSTKASASYACLEIRYAQQLLLRSCSFLRSRHHLPPPLLLNSMEVHFQRCHISIIIMTTSKAFCLSLQQRGIAEKTKGFAVYSVMAESSCHLARNIQHSCLKFNFLLNVIARTVVDAHQDSTTTRRCGASFSSSQD